VRLGTLELMRLLKIGSSSAMILGTSSQTKQSISSPWLDEVVQDLVQEPDLIRIKKLLIYTCTQTWESDLDRIHTVDLHRLLQTLLTIAPTPEQVQFVLHKVANSLNKAADYLLVANAVIVLIERRYFDTANASGTNADSANSQISCQTDYQTNYQTIAQVLHQDPEGLRIRKLLLLSCKNVWMSDPYQLNRLSLPILVQEMHGLATSIEELQIVLKSRVQKLSKSTEYMVIADKITQLFQPLYSVQLPSAVSALNPEPVDSTKLLSHLPQHLPKQSQSKPDKRSKSVFKKQLKPELIDWFDLRLEIIRYANPFRTKILLFSLLHEPFNQTPEHHLMLKNYPLDELLKILLQTYKSFTELDSNLHQVAKQLDEPETYSQIAQAILHIIRPFYAHSPMTSDFSASETLKHLDQITAAVETTGSKSDATGPEIS